MSLLSMQRWYAELAQVKLCVSAQHFPWGSPGSWKQCEYSFESWMKGSWHSLWSFRRTVYRSLINLFHVGKSCANMGREVITTEIARGTTRHKNLVNKSRMFQVTDVRTKRYRSTFQVRLTVFPLCGRVSLPRSMTTFTLSTTASTRSRHQIASNASRHLC